MRERPILFSGPMVRAILEGRKSQTRRPVKGWPDRGAVQPLSDGSWEWSPDGGFDHCVLTKRCPYGVPGDRLWVRETWRVGAWDEENGEIAVDYRAGDHARREWLPVTTDDDGEAFNRLWEQSCDDAANAGIKTVSDGRYHWAPGASPCRWRPSIFMPRWACRLVLELTAVRVERLQEISEADVEAEGIQKWPLGYRVEISGAPKYESLNFDSAKMAYRHLWDFLNAKRGFGWDVNPWVWVLEFRRV